MIWLSVLAGNDKRVIVTTIQKITTMMRKLERVNTKGFGKIKDLRVAFVVDECHRAVTPQTQKDIKGFFHNSLWYGFTGTPIFQGKIKRKAIRRFGTKPPTNNMANAYTSIRSKEAIHDGAVLALRWIIGIPLFSPIPEKDLPDSVL